MVFTALMTGFRKWKPQIFRKGGTVGMEAEKYANFPGRARLLASPLALLLRKVISFIYYVIMNDVIPDQQNG